MRVAVVGGGITGLAAAWELVQRRPDCEVTVYEPGRVGGRVLTTPLEGLPVDEGPDAWLTRVPDATALAAEVGLGSELVSPSAGRSLLWWGDRLRPLPDGLVLGVPRRLGAVARSGILSPAGALRAAMDLVLPRTPASADTSVHDLIATRFGRQVASRLVDPLVGGIHAGRTEELSAAATVPQLVAAATRSRSLLLGLRAADAAATGPVFTTPVGGVGRLVDALVAGLEKAGVRVRPTAVGSVVPGGGRLHLRIGTGDDVDDGHDGVVLAVPSSVAAETVAGIDPVAAAGLRSIEHASVVLTSLVYPAGVIEVPAGANGFLVPRSSGRLMTAGSFASSKWPHWARNGSTVLRLSAGRHRDDRAMDIDDAELVGRLLEELGAALGQTLPAPRTVRVSRWPCSFAQYTVGHLGRVAAVEASLAASLPGVALAGASYRGAGIPACIASGRSAAARLCPPSLISDL